MQDRAKPNRQERATQAHNHPPAPLIYAWTPPSDLPPMALGRELARISELCFDTLLVSPGAEGGELTPLCEACTEHNLRLVVRVGRGEVERVPDWLRAGAQGFLFTVAHALSPDAWLKLLPGIREAVPEAILIAEGFGRPVGDLLSLADAGFPYLLDNFAWWNLRDSWFLDQRAALAARAETIATLEPWPGPRLGDGLTVRDPELLRRLYQGRYALAAFISSGVLCQRGFEFGEGGETGMPGFDLSREVTRINRWHRTHGEALGETVLRRGAGPDAPIVALTRGSLGGEHAIILHNSSTTVSIEANLTRELAIATDGCTRFVDAFTGERVALDELTLERLETRLLSARLAPVSSTDTPAEMAELARDNLARNRIAIEAVSPQVDAGRFPVKRVLGETLRVEADILMDGHEVLAAVLKSRWAGQKDWRETPMRLFDNDRWLAELMLDRIGRLEFTVEAWRDLWTTWRAGTVKKRDAAQPVALELREGMELLSRYAEAASGEARKALDALLEQEKTTTDEAALYTLVTSEETRALTARSGLRNCKTVYAPVSEVTVDRPRAAFAAWYEVFPRSMSDDEKRHGTFDDVIAKLPYVKSLGFDVLYFPPIHPIGTTNRKGRNNTLKPSLDDPGSPYAIGSEEGGHDAIHKELGSFHDFRRLVQAAREMDIEIALDFAIQCSPDHPWIKQHPEWFDWRPDGTIKFAENPPKKYEDIVNIHFYRDAYPSIWIALRDIVLFWIAHGVTIFRVDNPHTKPLPFWEWMIADVQAKHPEAIFLSEAFTRPKMMKRLAKVGFTQSYSYFTWRNTKAELTDYLTELTRTEAREYMRPNFFVNTPDINPVPLQTSGRAGFQTRLVLAATLSPLYGVYNGFELCEATPVPGKEEYLDSEKYQLKRWDWNRTGNIRADIAAINRIRRDNPALWRFDNLLFLNAWNDNILVYAKLTESRDNVVLVAVNLDPHNAHGAHFEAPLWEFGLPDDAALQAVDLIRGGTTLWQGKVQHVSLDPADTPYAIWRLVPPGEP